MTKFRFECPVCKIGVNGRNARRHVRKVHGLDVPRDGHAFARRRAKAWTRDPKNWRRYRTWTWVRSTHEMVTKSSWIALVSTAGVRIGASAP